MPMAFRVAASKRPLCGIMLPVTCDKQPCAQAIDCASGEESSKPNPVCSHGHRRCCPHQRLPPCPQPPRPQPPCPRPPCPRPPCPPPPCPPPPWGGPFMNSSPSSRS